MIVQQPALRPIPGKVLMLERWMMYLLLSIPSLERRDRFAEGGVSMTRSEALQFITSYYRNPNPGDDDKFLFEEAQRYLIDTYHSPIDMHNLACFYMEERRHDLELKYLEMSAEYDYPPALEELGFIWYYGQTGEVDYRKAFEYFTRAAGCGDDVVRAWSTYKLADMYLNGHYVSKDLAKYRTMIESLYTWIMNPGKLTSMYPNPERHLPFADVMLRLAKIRAEDGQNRAALKLLREARRRLSEDIRDNPSWWGNIEVMERVVRLQHEVAGRDERALRKNGRGEKALGKNGRGGSAQGGIESSAHGKRGGNDRMDIFDVCYLADSPCRIAFLYNERRFIIDVVKDEDGCEGGNISKNSKNALATSIRFEGRWYRTAREFLEKAVIDGNKVVYLYDLLYGMEVDYG